jgi:DNA-binding CsgD family transcriptional regulator
VVSRKAEKNLEEKQMEKLVTNKRACDLGDTVTPENVQYIGEMMAICAIKAFAGHSGGNDYDRLYKGLLKDISRPCQAKDTVSEGYDLSQIAICFLCEHYGKTLNDIIGIDRRDKILTLKRACLRTVSKSITSYFSFNRRSRNIDDYTALQAPEEFVIDESINDETAVNKIIELLGLTDRQRDALICRMNGMSYPEAGRALSINQSSVYEIITKIRKLYLAMFPAPKFRYCK